MSGFIFVFRFFFSFCSSPTCFPSKKIIRGLATTKYTFYAWSPLFFYYYGFIRLPMRLATRTKRKKKQRKTKIKPDGSQTRLARYVTFNFFWTSLSTFVCFFSIFFHLFFVFVCVASINFQIK